MDKNRLVTAIRRAYKKFERDEWITGKLGKLNADGTYSFGVSGRPGFVHVTIRNSNGAQTVVAARNDASVEHAARLNVKMKLEYGVYVLYGRDGRADLGTNPVPPPYGIVAHGATHENGGGDDIGSITPGAYELVKANADGKIENGYLDLEGIVGSFVEGSNIDIDLTDPDNPVISVDLNESTAKVTPVDADSIPVIDSADSNVLKKTTWANVKATLKTYFDTLYNLYVHPNHTGDVTSVADGATTIAADAVTNAKAANMAESTIKGRAAAAGTGDPTDLTATQVRTIINVEDGADVTDAVNIASSIVGVAAKTTPVDADTIPLIDSAASNALKELSWANVKVTLKAYFDTLYGLLATANTWTQNQTISSTQTTGNALRVIRNLAAASTDDAVAEIVQDNASDDQPAVVVQQDGSGDILQLLDGATEVLVVEDGGKTVLRRGAAGQLLDIGTLSMSESGTTYVSGFYAFAADNVKFHLVGNAAGASILGGGVDGDTTRRLIIYADGKLEFGPGNAVRDTNLYRNAANELKTDDSLVVVGSLLKIAGTSTADAAVGGVMYKDLTDHAVTDGTLQDLASYSIPANTLSTNGDCVIVEVFGTTVANVNSKQVFLLFGATGLVSRTVGGVATEGGWMMRSKIYRTGAATQRAYSEAIYENPGASPGHSFDYDTPAETLSGAVTVKVQGDGIAAGDITVTGFIVSWEPNNT